MMLHEAYHDLPLLGMMQEQPPQRIDMPDAPPPDDRPSPEPGRPETEKPHPGKEINVPPREPEIDRPGTGPEIGPGADIIHDTPEAPAPNPGVEVPLPPRMA